MDHLTLLENRLEQEFDLASARIADSRFVQDWSDYQHRAGYINALRRIGDIIKEIRQPEKAHDDNAGIPSVLDDPTQGTEGDLVA